MLDLLFGKPRARSEYGSSGGWWGWNAMWVGSRARTQAGPLVDQELALTYSAVWCATRILVEGISSLPKEIYQRLDGDDRRVAYKHPVRKLLTLQPNRHMGSMAFREGRALHQVNWGNGFAEIQRNKYNEPVELNPIHAGRVRPLWPPDDIYSYLVRNNDGTESKMKPEEMYHLCGVLSEDGIWGKSIVPYAREDVGAGLAKGRHAANFFGAGGRPAGVLTIPGMKDREARSNFRAEWKQIHGNPDSGEIAILPPEAKWVPVTIPNEASQFIESQGASVEDVSRWWRVPLHMLSRLQQATWANIESLGIEFVIYSLLPWLRRTEEQDNLKLLQEDELSEFFIEHNFAGLLRGDIKTRMDAYHQALNDGVMTLNEVRRMENLNNIGPHGDKNFIQVNMTTVERLVSGPPALPVPGANAAGNTKAKPAAPAAAGEDKDPATLIEVPDIRQRDSYSCGAACAMSVGRYFNVGPTDLEEWKTALDTTEKNSTRPFKIVEYFTELGLLVTAGGDLDIDDLRNYWRKGMPTICPLQEYGLPSKQASFKYGHYVVVIGATLGYVFVQDPSIDTAVEGEDTDEAPGRMMITEEEFLEVWHDVDADGKPYIQFGIAVASNAEEEDEEDPAAETTDDDQGGESSQSPPGGSKDSAAGNGQGNAGDGKADAGTGEQRAAAQGVLNDTVARMLKIEANEARRATKKPKEFLTWLDSFYAKHVQTFASAIAPALSNWLAVHKLPDWKQPSEMAQTIAARHVEQSRQDLLRASECLPAELPALVEKTVEAWSKRGLQL